MVTRGLEEVFKQVWSRVLGEVSWKSRELGGTASRMFKIGILEITAVEDDQV